MRRIFFVLITLFAPTVFAPAAHSQGLSPISQSLKADRRGSASGEFTILNESLAPLAVTLEAKSLSWADGKLTEVRALDPGVQVILSETSALVPIKGRHTVAFKVTCATLPCYLNVFSLQRPVRHAGPGVSIAMGIGTAIYVCHDHVDHCKEQYQASLMKTQPSQAGN